MNRPLRASALTAVFLSLAFQVAAHNNLTTGKKSINGTQNEIIDEFAVFTDWMDRYAYIIELGTQLPPLNADRKVAANLTEGCESRVWIAFDLLPDGKIRFTADSDAIIVKGMVSLLMRVLSDRTPDEILNANLYFIEKIGLSDNLSPTRNKDLLAIINRIRNFSFTNNTSTQNE